MYHFIDHKMDNVCELQLLLYTLKVVCSCFSSLTDFLSFGTFCRKHKFLVKSIKIQNLYPSYFGSNWEKHIHTNSACCKYSSKILLQPRKTLQFMNYTVATWYLNLVNLNNCSHVWLNQRTSE